MLRFWLFGCIAVTVAATAVPASAEASPRPCQGYSYLGENGECITGPPGVANPDHVYLQYLHDHLGYPSGDSVDNRDTQLMFRTIGVSICEWLALGQAPVDVANAWFTLDDTNYEVGTKMRAASTAYCPWFYPTIMSTWPRR